MCHCLRRRVNSVPCNVGYAPSYQRLVTSDTGFETVESTSRHHDELKRMSPPSGAAASNRSTAGSRRPTARVGGRLADRATQPAASSVADAARQSDEPQPAPTMGGSPSRALRQQRAAQSTSSSSSLVPRAAATAPRQPPQPTAESASGQAAAAPATQPPRPNMPALARHDANDASSAAMYSLLDPRVYPGHKEQREAMWPWLRIKSLEPSQPA